MLRLAGILVCLIFLLSPISGQTPGGVLKGKVTFITSANVYVKFDDTETIAIGDTLFFNSNDALTPCLTVTNKSSSSCVCKRINDCDVSVDDELDFLFEESASDEILVTPIDEDDDEKINDPVIEPAAPEEVEEDDDELSLQQIRGRFSVASYSNMRENDDANHRLMTRFTLRANNINDSKYSFETYLNYRNNISETGTSSTSLSQFRVYNLALKYDVDSSTTIVVGRRVNNKISSVGAIDGLQGERQFGNISVGAIIGFRPDLREFDFNPKLLQYGAYASHLVQLKNVRTRTSAGLLEQRNGGAIDRRYAYFQHNSTINRKLSLFSSIEMDLYNASDTLGSQARLTNFYVSARYRFSRKISFSASYDSRKRVIYYETFRTEVENILADDQARQGIRLRLTGRPMKYVNVGIGYSTRFQNNDQNKSNLINLYLSHGNLPGIGGRLSITANQNESNYLESRILSVQHNRSIVKRKLDGYFYFRQVSYKYLSGETTFSQQYYGMSLSWRLTKTIMFNILGEYNVRDDENGLRVNSKIIKRFNSK